MMGGGGNSSYKVYTQDTSKIAYSVNSDTLVFGADVVATDLYATKTVAQDGSFVVKIQIQGGGAVEIDSGAEGALSHVQFANGTAMSVSDLIAASAGPRRVYNADASYEEYTTAADGRSMVTSYSAPAVK